MAQLPEIKTQRCILKPFGMENITDEYIAWLNDKEITQFSQQRFRKHDRQSCEAFLKSFDNAPHHFMAAFISETGQHIGNLSTTIDARNKVADIAILIGEKSIWGQGYGEELWSGMTSALFYDGIRLVTGGCMANNVAMVKLMQKAGMKEYFTRESYFIDDKGTPVDSVHFVSENPSWK